jgi:hypothetical protein
MDTSLPFRSGLLGCVGAAGLVSTALVSTAQAQETPQEGEQLEEVVVSFPA